MVTHRTIPVKMTTASMTTGKTVKTETIQIGIMPCKPGTCAICGVDHQPEMPHNAQSLYYQYTFKGRHGRWPTWADAVAHCTKEMKANWKREITKLGKWTAPKKKIVAEPYEVQP